MAALWVAVAVEALLPASAVVSEGVAADTAYTPAASRAPPAADADTPPSRAAAAVALPLPPSRAAPAVPGYLAVPAVAVPPVADTGALAKPVALAEAPEVGVAPHQRWLWQPLPRAAVEAP